MRLLTLALLVAPALAHAQPTASQVAAYEAVRLTIEGVETAAVSPGYARPGAVYAPPPVVTTTRTWRALQGGVPIAERDFYVAVGRDDLAGRVRSRQAVGTTLVVAGAAALLAGAGALFAGLATQEPTSSSRTLTVVGGAGVVAGGVGFQVGLNLGRRRVVTARDAAGLAYGHNVRAFEAVTALPATMDV